MKKVLILAYDFPPLISIGAQRPDSWYKYFPQCGYQVTVITRHWTKEIHLPEDYVKPTENKVSTERDAQTNGTIIRAPFKPNLRDKLLLYFGPNRLVLLRKLITFFYLFAEHLWLLFDNKAGIYYAADEYLKNNKADFIIATGEPFILFKYANSLSQKFNIPWVADYRDGWTTNQGNYKLGFLARLQRAFYKIRETKYIAGAKHITTAAPEYAAALKQAHSGKNVSVIFNGYDEDVFEPLKNIEPAKEEFVISYGGIVYPHQNLEMFLTGLEKFMSRKEDGKPVAVNFYGLQPEVRGRIAKYESLKGVISYFPRIPYAEIVVKLKQSHLLLLLSAKNANWLNAKVFDYLATGRPVMLVENDCGILEKLLQEMNGGETFETAEEVCQYLLKTYAAFNAGIISTQAVSEKVRNYTRKNGAKSYCELLDTMNRTA